MNRLQDGCHSQNDIEQLKTRILQSNHYNSNITHWFTTNKSVDNHNNETFRCCSDSKAEIEAVDIVVGNISDDKKQQFKQRIPSDSTKAIGLHSHLYRTHIQRHWTPI